MASIKESKVPTAHPAPSSAPSFDSSPGVAPPFFMGLITLPSASHNGVKTVFVGADNILVLAAVSWVTWASSGSTVLVTVSLRLLTCWVSDPTSPSMNGMVVPAMPATVAVTPAIAVVLALTWSPRADDAFSATSWARVLTSCSKPVQGLQAAVERLL